MDKNVVCGSVHVVISHALLASQGMTGVLMLAIASVIDASAKLEIVSYRALFRSLGRHTSTTCVFSCIMLAVDGSMSTVCDGALQDI